MIDQLFLILPKHWQYMYAMEFANNRRKQLHLFLNSSPYYAQLDVHFYRIQTIFFLMKEKDTLGRNFVHTLYQQSFLMKNI